MARARRVFYKPPVRVHEGRRAEHIIFLMQHGFRRWEARELSWLPRGDPALQAMVKQRRQMVSRIFRLSAREGLTKGQAQYRVSRAIRSFYINKVKVSTQKRDPDTGQITDRARRGYPHQWRAKLIRISQYIRKGTKFAGIVIKPRDFKETPQHKGMGRDDSRRVRRKKAIRDAKHVEAAKLGGVPLSKLQSWHRYNLAYSKGATGQRLQNALKYRAILAKAIREAGGIVPSEA